MLNRAPIVLNCFSRGGSNILWNILLSHPDACSPIEETLQIFRLDWRAPRPEGLKAALLTRQPRLFNQWHLQPRLPIPPRAQAYLDAVLFRWKLKTLDDEEMRCKSGTERYTRLEVENARLVLKNNNALLLLSDLFAAMYPDAAFFALVRDPIPLYESHKRHKTPPSRSTETFAAFYTRLAGQMQADSARLPRYHLLRFEDLLHNPADSARRIYELAGLDPARVPQLRFKAKPHMQADGSHTTQFEAGRHYWFGYDELSRILEPEINAYQSSRLDSGEAGRLRALLGGLPAQLGYAPP
jgi:hypothetical protein